MTIALLVVGVLLVLGVALAVADRVCAQLAERRAAAYLTEPFGQPPVVRVHGMPFLTQALRGNYADIEVSGDGLRLGELAATSLTAHLYNASLPPRELLRRTATSLPCERLVGMIVLPYDELARVSRIPGLTLNYEHDRLVATASLPVPGVSQLARVSGEAQLSIAGNRAVWLRVRDISVAGISLPTVLLKQLVPSLNVPIPVPTLPYGLRLDELKPLPSGLLVCGSAPDVVFTAPS
jgi:hypothetical protein